MVQRKVEEGSKSELSLATSSALLAPVPAAMGIYIETVIWYMHLAKSGVKISNINSGSYPKPM